MLLRNTLLPMLALGLSMVAFSSLASQDRTGVIRSVDLTNRHVMIDEQRYRLGDHTRVINLTRTGGGLHAGYPVHFSVDRGELKQITVYPKNPTERRHLGYRNETDFPQ